MDASDLISEPEVTEIEVTDIDVCFPNGLHPFSIRMPASLKFTHEDITVVRADPQETIIVDLTKAYWYSVRPRKLKVPKLPERSTPQAPGAPPEITSLSLD